MKSTDLYCRLDCNVGSCLCSLGWLRAGKNACTDYISWNRLPSPRGLFFCAADAVLDKRLVWHWELGPNQGSAKILCHTTCVMHSNRISHLLINGVNYSSLDWNTEKSSISALACTISTSIISQFPAMSIHEAWICLPNWWWLILINIQPLSHRYSPVDSKSETSITQLGPYQRTVSLLVEPLCICTIY